MFKPTKGYWSLLKDVQDPAVIRLAMWAWTGAVVGLLLGAATRLSAVATWVLSTSFANINPSIDNAGDTVRGIALFYLMLCPCGAAWSVDSWVLGRRRGVLVHPWPLRLLFVQMALIYFANGVHKVVGSDWPRGNSLYFVLADTTLTRFSYAQVTLPYTLTRLMTWLVLSWEVSFPLLMIWRPVRIVALCFGALFHAGIFLSMELGGFGPYMLCLYLPLLPWERWADRQRASGGRQPPVDSTDLPQGGLLDRQEVGAAHADGDAVVPGVEVDAGLPREGGVARGGQAEQAAERRDGPGL
jgi:hypothetical protein